MQFGKLCTYGTLMNERMNDKSFKVAGHLRYKGATPNPSVGIVRNSQNIMTT